MYRRISYCNDVTVEISISDKVKISEAAINKALMIVMNYLIESMETDKQESAE